MWIITNSLKYAEKWIILFTITDEKVNCVPKEEFRMRILYTLQVNPARIPIFHLPPNEEKLPHQPHHLINQSFEQAMLKECWKKQTWTRLLLSYCTMNGEWTLLLGHQCVHSWRPRRGYMEHWAGAQTCALCSSWLHQSCPSQKLEKMHWRNAGENCPAGT